MSEEVLHPAWDGGTITDEEDWLRIDKPVRPILRRPPDRCDHWFDPTTLEQVAAEPKLYDEIVDPKWVPGGDGSDSPPPPRLLLSNHPAVAVAWGKNLETRFLTHQEARFHHA